MRATRTANFSLFLDLLSRNARCEPKCFNFSSGDVLRSVAEREKMRRCALWIFAISSIWLAVSRGIAIFQAPRVAQRKRKTNARQKVEGCDDSSAARCYVMLRECSGLTVLEINRKLPNVPANISSYWDDALPACFLVLHFFLVKKRPPIYADAFSFDASAIA